jgi:hypothetical protein
VRRRLLLLRPQPKKMMMDHDDEGLLDTSGGVGGTAAALEAQRRAMALDNVTEGVRLPLLRVLRMQWQHIPLFCVRVALFSMLQLFLNELMRARDLHANKNDATANNNNTNHGSSSSSSSVMMMVPVLLLDDRFLAITASCWLIVGCTWATVGMLHTFVVWCRTPLRQSRLSHIVWNYMCTPSLINDMGLTNAPPWGVWIHMNACGFALFVLGYSLSGLFWLPQQALLLSSTVAFMSTYPPKAFRRGRWLGALCVLCASLLLIGDEALHASFEEEARSALFTTHAWVWGVMMPVGLVWLLAASRSNHLNHAGNTHHHTHHNNSNGNPNYGNNNGMLMIRILQHSDALMAFSLPSLMLIGLIYFSSTSRTTTLMPMMLVHHPRPPEEEEAPLSTLDSMIASEPVMLDVINATRTYYYDSIAPSLMGWFPSMMVSTSSDSVGGLLAIIMAPTLLWLCVLIVLRALARSGMGSTLSAYALAVTTRSKGSNDAPHTVAIVLLCLATPLLLIPELRALEETRLQTTRPVIFVGTHVILPAYVLPYEEEEEEDEDNDLRAVVAPSASS